MENETVTSAGNCPVDGKVMQHTPGEWFASCADQLRTDAGHHVQWLRYDISANSENIKDDAYYRVASVSNVNNSEQNLSNALLIAAAPDLLAALKVVVNDWTQQFERAGHMAPAWCKQARAAIAKATERAA